jgi:hypothetical protein
MQGTDFARLVIRATKCLERDNVAEAEAVISVEGNMCGTVMRGAAASPGSKATSRRNGTHRNLRGLTSGHRP